MEGIHLWQIVRSLLGEVRGAELFARNATEGWFSWGNQALQFNDTRHFARPGT